VGLELGNLCKEGKVAEAIEYLGQGGVTADYNSVVALLESCANLKSLDSGKKVHEFLRTSNFGGDIELSNKLIEMYAKCGSARDARRVFDKMRERNMGSWHLMIKGYAANGEGNNGLLLFKQMSESGLQPNGETFVAVLAACATAQDAGEGLKQF